MERTSEKVELAVAPQVCPALIIDEADSCKTHYQGEGTKRNADSGGSRTAAKDTGSLDPKLPRPGKSRTELNWNHPIWQWFSRGNKGKIVSSSVLRCICHGSAAGEKSGSE